MKRRKNDQRAQAAALRACGVEALPRQSQLPRALLKAGRPAQVGLLRLLGIDAGRFHRERRRGLLDVFRLDVGVYGLEIPTDHEGPWSDFAAEANA